MSEKELADLIHESVYRIFNANPEQLHQGISSLALCFNPSTQDALENQTKALLRYAIIVSEMSCTAMVKTLNSLGYLHILPTDD